MKLHDLKPAVGAKRKRNRVGRGIAAGQGKTAGRGQKGQGSRSGGIKGPQFEGGQLPYVRRLPFKRGFNNIFKIYYQEVNVGDLNELPDGTVVTGAMLAEMGIVRKADAPTVILGDGDLTKKLTIHAERFSKSAQTKIAAVGGSTEVLPLKLTGARATIKLMRKVDIANLSKK